jgi:23S rRNA (pseudouridine1915-N3)-methyltransferase
VRIRLLCITNRQPGWVAQGYQEYARRMRGSVRLELTEIPLCKRRGSQPVDRSVADEGERLLRQVPPGAFVVALDAGGQAWTTTRLAARLERWQRRGREVALLIGGPDGLAPACLERAEARWSLSALTLPHGLVRVVVAEALYRAHSLNEGHPYHRA